MSQVTNTERAASPQANLPAIAPPRLPYHPATQDRFGIGVTEWRALVDAIYPLAKESSSVILALSYCKARKLDPFKRPVHIVPMWNVALKRMVETVWPGIGELRTTAFRTGQYAGRDEATYGPDVREKIGTVDMVYPEWCQVTVFRFLNKQRLPFPGPRVYWKETYATTSRDDPSPNSMWRRRTHGQIDKCAEAAALRAAFPEEVGNEYSAEEMSGQVIEGAASEAPAVSRPVSKSLAGRLTDLAATASEPAHDPETGEIIEGPADEPSPDRDINEDTETRGDAPREGSPEQSTGGAGTLSASVGSGDPAQTDSSPPTADAADAGLPQQDAGAAAPTRAPASDDNDDMFPGDRPSKLDPIEVARGRGAEAYRKGMARKAMPPEYRERSREDEAHAWTAGYEAARKADEQKGGER